MTKYLLRFDNLLYRAGAAVWLDEAKVIIFKGSFNAAWKARVKEYLEALEVYADLLDFLRRFDGNDYLSGGYVDVGDPMQIGITRVRSNGGVGSVAAKITLE